MEENKIKEDEQKISLDELAKIKLMEIIREKINWKENKETLNGIEYDGFNMSGYNDAHYHNLEIVSRFKNYMTTNFKHDFPEDRTAGFIIPVFWKGCGDLVRTISGAYDGPQEWITKNGSLAGQSTDEIIFKCITAQNPSILKSIISDEKEIYEDFIADLTDTESKYEKTEIIKRFKRNIKIVKELKKKYFSCQICGFSFKKKNGEYYNETHHIILLSEKGKDDKKNILVLCPNCHKQLHYADTDIKNLYNNIIIINGVSKKIKRE